MRRREDPMAMHRLRARFSPLVIAALGLAGCNVTGRDEGAGAGIHVDLSASDETRNAIGVASWEVSAPTSETLAVIGRGSSGEIVAQVNGMNGETLVVEMASSGHRLVIDTVNESASDDFDANDLAVL